MSSDGEGGYYWSGYYNVHVHVPPVNYGGGDPVYVTYIWENGAAVQPVPVDGNGDATWTIRYDGHSIVVTKGRYDDPNHTVLASFGMGRDTNTASVPMTYTLPDSVTVSTVDQLADNGEGGYVGTGYYYVTVHVPPVNLHVGDDKYYVTYSWDNGASIAWNIPVDSNGNATQLVRYDGHGITVTKGAYGRPDYVVLASFGLDRTTYNATVQMTLTPAPAVISIPVTANAARVVFTPVNGASIEAYKVRKAGTSGAGNLDANFEFEVLARLNPGTEYNYDVYAANGTQLDRVHGFLGTPGSNASYYTLTDTRTVTPNSTRSDNGGPAYSQHVDPRADAGTVANNTYLRNLVIGVSQGGTNSHIIDRKQTYNAFGEVISETDGNGNVTDLVYNDLGKLITKQAPATSVYGDATRRRPTTRYYYDELGQLVGTQDAVSELSAVKYYSTRVRVAGRVEKEFDANGKSKVYRYDRRGNQRLVRDEGGQDTEYRYDRVGRLTRLIHYDTNHSQYSFDQFFYDALGTRFKHITGLGYQETYLYDGQRRVRRHISFGGAQTSYDYSYVSPLGVGGIGGYEKKTTTAGIVGNDVQLDRTDYFGKLLYHKDMGGHEFTYQYNNAGWLKQQDGTTGQHITYDYYQNGYLKTVTDTAINSLGQFQYDNNGNRIREEYSTIPLGGSQPTPYQLAKAQYDELNRVTHVNDDGRFDVTYTYDANGNRRSIVSNYSDLLTNNPQTQKFYYNYDRMNRFVTTMGQLDAAGNIVRGPDGYDIEYDGAGRRKKVYSDHLDGSSAAVHLMEEYTYDPINTVKDTFITDSTVPTAPTVRHTLRQNDVIGRVTDYTEYDTAGAQTRWVHYGYDNDNRTTLEETHDPLKTGYQSTVYHYVGGGILDYSQTKTLSEPAPGQQLANSATVTLTYTYEKWDSYKQSLVTINGAAAGTYGWKDGTSTYSYDINGHIARMLDSQAGRTLTYINNHLGQTLRRDEVKSGGTSPSVRSFYSLNGITIGDVGTDRVLSRVDYAQALADYDSRTLEDYISRHGNVGNDGTESGYNVREKVTRDRNITQRVFPVTSADFDNNYQPITDSYPAHAAQSFVTRAGDSLQSIALALWGDSSLWYLLADANGLSGTQQLPADLRLTIPNVVTNVHNNAGTFRPYDAGLALGDTTPTLPNPPPPPQDDGCGTMGMIVVMVVVIIVCIFTEQWYLL